MRRVPLAKPQQPFIYRSARHYSSTGLTHLDDSGRATMVDVGDKAPTKRTATATGRIFISQEAYELVTSNYLDQGSDRSPSSQTKKVEKVLRKGDALTVARLAAIMGAKQTSNLIPLCHPLSISNVDIKLTPEVPERDRHRHSIVCEATVSCEGKTGVEMESLTAVSVGLLTVWDMLKALDGRTMEIGEIFVKHKGGGRSGDFER